MMEILQMEKAAKDDAAIVSELNLILFLILKSIFSCMRN